MNHKIRITKLFSFEMAHALENHDGMCQNLHGHSYKLRVTVMGEPASNGDSPKVGMLMDFSDLKNIVNRHIIEKYDHALVLKSTTDNQVVEVLKKQYQKIEVTDYQPTSEQLLLNFVTILQQVLPPNVQLFSLRLSETDTSYAEWFREDNC
ncbi:MAG: 6-carboxytetrahydropterin synthase [Lentimicrobiaceae bacterium]|nr:6-carboxytetrahydropterin synthase [Lentimicrobiaceae bacterium]